MSKFDATLIGCQAGWRKYEGNPIIGDENDFKFDNHVVKLEDKYRMYYSWRNHYSIAMTESLDGIHWSEPVLVIQPRPETGWEDDINRGTIVYKDGFYQMWYSGQTTGGVEMESDEWTEAYLEASTNESGTSAIGYATSEDGVNWQRYDEPVILPSEDWEMQSLMCPSVIWDEEEEIYKMWYCGGEWFEPNAIGYATSKDGVHWEKYSGNPMYTANPENIWERARVAGPHVVKRNDWYYMFYIGYEDLFKARMCLARSRDGVTGWERHPENPIISPGAPGGWECESIYKPFVMYEEELGRWTMWYNARQGTIERIGIAMHDGEDLGF